jgi:S1-C subfamily serine protease
MNTYPLRIVSVLVLILIVLTGCASASSTSMRVPTATPVAQAPAEQASTADNETGSETDNETDIEPSPTMSNPTQEHEQPQEPEADATPHPTEPSGSTVEPVRAEPGENEQQPGEQAENDDTSALAQSDVIVALQETLQHIYDHVSPSVVNIRVLQRHSTSMTPEIPNFPFPEESPDMQPPDGDFFSEGLGSGFVWDTEGHIVTNNHVVQDADRITITFADGRIEEAELVGSDRDSDLAVVKVEVSADRLQPIEVVDSNGLKVGQLVVAVGNPFGLEGTMTVGFVSALGRTLPVQMDTPGPAYSIPDIIQTDASINPGNSGGAMVDDRGRLIGVPSAIRSPVRASAGVGFAIPSTIVQQVVPVLIEQGYYEHPWVGVSGRSLNPDFAREMGLDPDQRGALIMEVMNGSPADKAGLQGSDREVTIDGVDVLVGGDVIVGFDGRPVQEFDDLIAYLARYTNVGQTVTLTILRDGEEMDIDLTLEPRPDEVAQEEPLQPDMTDNNAWLGIQGRTLTSGIAEEMELDADQQGVLVSQVESDSPADEAGLRGSFKNAVIDGEQVRIGGDVITAINGEEIQRIEDLIRFVRQASPGDEITLTILRNGEEMELDVTLDEQPEE